MINLSDKNKLKLIKNEIFRLQKELKTASSLSYKALLKGKIKEYKKQIDQLSNGRNYCKAMYLRPQVSR